MNESIGSARILASAQGECGSTVKEIEVIPQSQRMLRSLRHRAAKSKLENVNVVLKLQLAAAQHELQPL